jgi:hypothetical protein
MWGSEIEVKERKDDAMHATRAAVVEGIPAGRRRCAAARGRVIVRPAGSSPILRGDHEAPGGLRSQCRNSHVGVGSRL